MFDFHCRNAIDDFENPISHEINEISLMVIQSTLVEQSIDWSLCVMWVFENGQWQFCKGIRIFFCDLHLLITIRTIFGSMITVACIVVWQPLMWWRNHASKNVEVWKRNPFTEVITWVFSLYWLWIGSLFFLYYPLPVFLAHCTYGIDIEKMSKNFHFFLPN